MHRETRQGIFKLLDDIGIHGVADTSVGKLELILDYILKLLAEHHELDRVLLLLRYFGLPGHIRLGKLTYREIGERHGLTMNQSYQKVKKCLWKLAEKRDEIYEIIKERG